MTRPKASALVRVATQNVTEGLPTSELRGADIVVGQEVDRRRWVSGLPGKVHWFPPEDKRQAISWNPEALWVEKRGYVRFHRSGRAEGWPYRSPARGFLFVKGRLGTDGPKVVVVGTWILNSWNPIHPDRDTPHRNKVGRKSLRILRRRLAFWRAQGYTIILAGDFNSLRWPGRIPGLTQIHARGLDRAYITKRGALQLVGQPTRGPKTGVGNDMRHESILFTLTPKEH